MPLRSFANSVSANFEVDQWNKRTGDRCDGPQEREEMKRFPPKLINWLAKITRVGTWFILIPIPTVEPSFIRNIDPGFKPKSHCLKISDTLPSSFFPLLTLPIIGRQGETRCGEWLAESKGTTAWLIACNFIILILVVSVYFL